MLAWTLEALAASPVVERMVVVASAGNIAEISGAPWLPGARDPGRRRRRPAAGLRGGRRGRAGRRPGDGAAADRVILVHDGARPLVSAALIESVARAVELHGAAIPVMPVAETVKRVADELVAETVDRSDLVTAQTPQGVRAGLLAACLRALPARRPGDVDRRSRPPGGL